MRDWVALLALASHVLVTSGFPLPVPRSQKGSQQAFPCQSRPCGCLTAELCWAGDCCCFTIEQKLGWADANGVTPPDHVRPLVESRRAKESGRSAGAAARDTPAAAECPHCTPQKECCEKPAPTVRWVAGVFAQKCRGEGPAGLLRSEPAIVQAFEPVQTASPQRDSHLPPRSERPVSLAHRPPARPPRV